MRDDDVHDLIEAALKTADDRNLILEIMRHALLAGDDTTALTLARRLCGIEDFDFPKAKKKHGSGFSLPR